VIIDNKTGRTTKPGVWAGGDVATGAATVISAMGAARIAASDMNRFLRGEESASWL
jgi:glutamate synthase (NADPH/NADH) small chain